MTIAATSLAAALWDKYGRIDAIRRSSRKDAQQMLMCFCIDNVLSRWTPRYLTDVLKGTLFPSMFAHSLSTDLRQDTEPTGITSDLSVFNLSLLLFNIISTCLNTGLNRKELIRWGTFGQLSVIGVLVIVTIMVEKSHLTKAESTR